MTLPQDYRSIELVALQRFTKGQFRTDAVKWVNGFMRVPVVATRTGVLDYVRTDGKVVREARLPQEVFADESVDSIRGIPVTNEHPPGLVTPENAKTMMVGYTGESVAKRDERYLETTVTITDKATIDEVLKGKVEVSMGYEVEKDDTPGQFDGQEFDLVQRNIRYNHLAIVRKGRAGSDVRLRLDGSDNEIGGSVMKKITLDGKEHELEGAVFDAIEKDRQGRETKEKARKDAADAEVAKLNARLDGSSKKISELEDAIEEAKKKVSGLEAALDDEKAKAEKEKPNADAVEKMATEIVRVQKVAAVVLDAEEMKDKKAAELKRLVIKKDSPSVEDAKLESDTYVDARFDAITERVLATNADEWGKVSAAMKRTTEPGVNPDAEKARIKQQDDALAAWKAKPSMSVA